MLICVSLQNGAMQWVDDILYLMLEMGKAEWLQNRGTHEHNKGCEQLSLHLYLLFIPFAIAM